LLRDHLDGIADAHFRVESVGVAAGVAFQLFGAEGGLDELDQLIDDYGIEEVRADVLLNQSGPWIDDCFEVIDKCHPIFHHNRWVTMKGADTVHAIIANLVHASQIATLDNDFKSLSNGVTPLVLWDVY
jgi:hypothetical protein